MAGEIARNSSNLHDQDTGIMTGYINPITGKRQDPVPGAGNATQATALASFGGLYSQAFIIGGQSNADGRGSLSSATALAEKTSPAALLYTKGGQIELCAEPASKQDTGWWNNIPSGVSAGPPGYSFTTAAAKEIARLTGIKPCMVPCAIGATGLDHWAPPVVERTLTSLFGQMQVRAEAAKLAGLQPVFIWSGHENGAAAVTETLATGALGFASTYAILWRTHWDSIRSRFPGCGIIYVQLGCTDDLTETTGFRRAGEIQRLSESTYGDAASIVTYVPVTTAPPWLNTVAGTNGTNTAVNNGNGSVVLVGDGTTSLGASLALLDTGVAYRISYTWAGAGTGAVKLLMDGVQSGTIAANTSGTAILTAGATGILTVFRLSGGTVVNGTFTITGFERVLYAMVPSAAMVVQHDLPRNASTDDIHYSAQAHLVLGRRIAAAYAGVILGDTRVNGRGPRLVSCTKSGATVRVRFDKTVQANANGYGVALATSLFRVYAGGVEATLVSCARDTPDTDILITCSATLTGVIVMTYGDRAGPGTEIYRDGCVYDADGMPAPTMGPVIATA